MLGNNNLSKIHFADFLEKFGYDREEETRRQVFLIGQEPYCFSFTPTGNDPQCRQMYTDCVGFVTYMEETDQYLIADVSMVELYPYTRTMRNGVTAHSVKLNRSEMKELTLG